MSRKHHHHETVGVVPASQDALPAAPAGFQPLPSETAPLTAGDVAWAVPPVDPVAAVPPIDPVAAVPPETDAGAVFGTSAPAIDTAPFVERSASVMETGVSGVGVAGTQPHDPTLFAGASAVTGTTDVPAVAGVPAVGSYSSTTIEQSRLAAVASASPGTSGRRVIVTLSPEDEMSDLEAHPDPVVRARAVEAGVAIRAGAPNAGILARAARDLARMADGRR